MTDLNAPEASARLSALAAEAWDGFLATQPVFATSLGDRRFDDRLSPNGPGASEANGERIDALLRRARALDPAGLSPADRVTRDALIDFLGSELDLVDAGLDQWSVDPLDGPQVDFLNIPSFQTTRDRAEAEALVARWRELGPWVDRLTDSTRACVMAVTRG